MWPIFISITKELFIFHSACGNITCNYIRRAVARTEGGRNLVELPSLHFSSVTKSSKHWLASKLQLKKWCDEVAANPGNLCEAQQTVTLICSWLWQIKSLSFVNLSKRIKNATKISAQDCRWHPEESFLQARCGDRKEPGLLYHRTTSSDCLMCVRVPENGLQLRPRISPLAFHRRG